MHAMLHSSVEGMSAKDTASHVAAIMAAPSDNDTKESAGLRLLLPFLLQPPLATAVSLCRMPDDVLELLQPAVRQLIEKFRESSAHLFLSDPHLRGLYLSVIGDKAIEWVLPSAHTRC